MINPRSVFGIYIMPFQIAATSLDPIADQVKQLGAVHDISSESVLQPPRLEGILVSFEKVLHHLPYRLRVNCLQVLMYDLSFPPSAWQGIGKRRIRVQSRPREPDRSHLDRN